MEYYQLSAKEVLRSLGTGRHGLSHSQVAARQREYGKNSIRLHSQPSFPGLFAKQFGNYLVWLLIVVATIAFLTGIYLGKKEQLIDGIIIYVIVVLNSVIGAYQDYRAEKAAHLLKSMLKNEALVNRSGTRKRIDHCELVPGDIIFLREGDKVPADARVIECDELNLDESMLTGESLHVKKSSKAIKKSSSLLDRKNCVFMNTFVTRGSAVCVVTATGRSTEVGRIAESLEISHESQFLAEIDDASRKISYVAILLIISALSIYYVHNQSWIAMFMLGSALVVGSIPEGLPAIVTFALSIGSSKLAKKNVLVKRKTLLETLGGVDVICTDKTGTLTENKMVVSRVYAQGKVMRDLRRTDSVVFEAFRNCAILCNEAKDTDRGFVGEAEDIALVDFFNKQGVDIIRVREKYPYRGFVPFSSDKKYATSKNLVSGRVVSYCKGAPEVVLAGCRRILVQGRPTALTERHRQEIHRSLHKFSEEALRNIAFSCNDIFIGIAAMHDPPRKGIREVVRTIRRANIELKMITGDNVHTAKAIARECGFKRIKATSWDEIRDLSEYELKKTVLEYNVFARMSPEYKLKIVTALQDAGKRVAITGDGVNDVPALKKADVGIAMGKRGSDIAKEAGDLIILDDNLESVVAGIKEGRTIFSNMRKVINYLLTANLAEILMVFCVAMFGLVPFLPIQLLWVNFVTDIVPAMSLSTDPSHEGIMRKRPTGKNEKILNRRIIWLTVGISIKKVLIMLAIFFGAFFITGNVALAQTMTFTWLVISHFIRIVAIRLDERVNIFINRYLNWSMAVPLLVQILILYSPLSFFFHTVRLSAVHWAALAAMVAAGIWLAKVVTDTVDRHLPAQDTDY